MGNHILVIKQIIIHVLYQDIGNDIPPPPPPLPSLPLPPLPTPQPEERQPSLKENQPIEMVMTDVGDDTQNNQVNKNKVDSSLYFIFLIKLFS